jgi:hypothetical protein
VVAWGETTSYAPFFDEMQMATAHACTYTNHKNNRIEEKRNNTMKKTTNSEQNLIEGDFDIHCKLPTEHCVAHWCKHHCLDIFLKFVLSAAQEN